MGRQVCFFITPHDLRCFLDTVLSDDIIILDDCGKKITSDVLCADAEDVFNKKQGGAKNFYFTKNGFNIAYNPISKKLDSICSEVIEFNYGGNSPKMRLDTSSVDKRFSKNGFIVIDDTDAYYKMLEDIYANPVYIDNPNYVENGYEHGRLWFDNTYYDENGIKTAKREELTKLYNQMKRFATKNWKLSNDKFGYIGTDAYELYLKNRFRPCSGKFLIKFV